MWLADCELLMYLIDNKLVFKIPNSQALMNVFNNIKLKQILTEFFACFFYGFFACFFYGFNV